MGRIRHRLGAVSLAAGLAAAPAAAQPDRPAADSAVAARVDEYLRCVTGCKDAFDGGEHREAQIECVRGCRAAITPLPDRARGVPRQR